MWRQEYNAENRISTVKKMDGAVSTTRKYYAAVGQKIAVRTKVNSEPDTLNWQLSDHLGSTSMAADASGEVISEIRYTAFGETRYENGVTPTDYRYTGQREEAELGLYYYVARWYDPALGRFTQADTIVPNPGSAKTYDRYAYVMNNPMKYVDPSGHYPIECATWESCEPEPEPECDQATEDCDGEGDEEPKRIGGLQEGAGAGVSASPLEPAELLLAIWKDPLGGEYKGQNFGQKRGVRPTDPMKEAHCVGCREYHMAIDSFGEENTPIYPGMSGTVVFVNTDANKWLGVFIIVDSLLLK